MPSPDQPLDVDALREEFLNVVYDEYELTLDADKLADYAASCGETASKFTDVNDPDFQAPPTIGSSLQPQQRMPSGFPTFKGLGMDAGKAVRPDKPMHAGVPITARTHMHALCRGKSAFARAIRRRARTECPRACSRLRPNVA